MPISEFVNNLLEHMKEFGGIPFTIFAVIFMLSVICTPFAILSLSTNMKKNKEQTELLTNMFYMVFFKPDGTTRDLNIYLEEDEDDD